MADAEPVERVRTALFRRPLPKIDSPLFVLRNAVALRHANGIGEHSVGISREGGGKEIARGASGVLLGAQAEEAADAEGYEGVVVALLGAGGKLGNGFGSNAFDIRAVEVQDAAHFAGRRNVRRRKPRGKQQHRNKKRFRRD